MAKRKGSQNRLRIIGGQWRSRQLPFIEVSGLRPTPDRVRETLFNWLQGNVTGARCLDLFAGSGAIGFEALSRHAADVIFVEKHARVARQLTENLAVLEADELSRGTVVNMDAIKYLNQSLEPFDLIFLDPPYRKDFLPSVLDKITTSELLKPEGLIYLEHESEEEYEWSDWNLTTLKTSGAGQVSCVLLKAEPPV